MGTPQVDTPVRVTDQKLWQELISTQFWVCVDFRRSNSGHADYIANIINDVIEQQMVSLLPVNCYLVANNASIHNEAALSQILATKT